tara:strand:- start:769 stop:1914 length:1146 start_codon:yes stop_codon:yes gene_type:complete
MKILFVSMNSIHFQSWANQLKDSGHEVYWFDILDAGKKEAKLYWMNQITNWKLKLNFPFRYFIKKSLPKLYTFIKRYNENDTVSVFEKKLLEIQPDVVHSFALQISCIPILSVMQKHSNFKWIYSSWGSDMYYSKEIGISKSDLEACLKRINFLITDCKRDYKIAQQKGFNNTFLGDFPGNGGIIFNENDIKYNIEERDVILIKGYNDAIGKGINIVKAFTENLITLLNDYEIIIFGADKEVENYIKSSIVFAKLNYKLYTKTKFIPNEELILIMGKSYVYIGNSYSDGIPNALLEAMGMGAFPIQSSPGGATSEVVEHSKNGLLISNPDDINEIEGLIHSALTNKKMVNEALVINTKIIKDKYERGIMRSKILKIYEGIN